MLRTTTYRRLRAGLLPTLALGVVFFMSGNAQALTASLNGSISVTAVVPLQPPANGAVIQTPAPGSVFATTPLVVRGTCQANTLVRVFNNGQLAGSIACSDIGDFVMNITLQPGRNALSAQNYDIENQAGPTTPTVVVTVTELRESAGSTDDARTGAPASDNLAERSQERLFEGTFIEPVAHVLGVNSAVSTSVNKTINYVANGVFVGLIILILCLVLI